MRRASHLRRVTSTSERPAPAAPVSSPLSGRQSGAPHAIDAAVVLQRGEVVAVPRENGAQGGLEIAVGGTALPATVSPVVASWRPSVGDRVLVCFDQELPVVVAVLAAARSAAVALSDGCSVQVEGAHMRLLDPEGRILVVYAEGRAEIAAPSGDLHLRAPSGAVRIESATDIQLQATRDLVATSGRSTELGLERAEGEHAPKLRIDRVRVAVTAPELRADARVAKLHATTAAAVARDLALAAEKLVTKVTTIETTTERAVFRAKTLVQQVSGVLETKAGRMRALVAGAWSVRSQSTALRSTDDTSVDGKRVLLG